MDKDLTIVFTIDELCELGVLSYDLRELASGFDTPINVEVGEDFFALDRRHGNFRQWRAGRLLVDAVVDLTLETVEVK